MIVIRHRKELIVGLMALVAVLAANAWIGYRQTQKLYGNAAWVAHTHEVLASLNRVQGTVTDGESGQGSFFITGDEKFRKHYDAARREFGEIVESLQRLTADNPRQQERVSRLDELGRERWATLEEVIELQKAGEAEAARAVIASGRGLKTMQEIRSLIGEMTDEESKLLAAREADNLRGYESALSSILLGVLLAICAVGAFQALLVRYVRNLTQSSSVIHEQREQLHAMLLSIGDGVIATDVEGRVTLMNPVAQTLTGWTLEAAHGQPLERVFQIVNESTRQTVENPAHLAMREGSVVGLANHTVLLARDGTEWPIDDSGAVVRNERQEVAGAILVFREIRERRRQEAELQNQAIALQEADRRKDEFLATLAHELRNPLAPISNALQVWTHVNGDQAQLQQLHQIMERQVRQMSRLIDDLLDVSRITRGKIQLRKEPVDLETVIAAAVEAVQPLIDGSQHQLTVSVPHGQFRVSGDVARLTQIFGNILQNAAKFTPQGGRLGITGRRDGNEAIVSIRDNGPGIPANMLNQIFEMFRQVDQTLERPNGGLGIGLTLVKRLVELHGGNVEAHSDGSGQGSEFVVRLPLLELAGDKRDVEQAAVNGDSGHSLPAFKVLVVDDVRASGKTLALMLQAIGQEAQVLQDGAAAVDWVAAQRPDVVFLDIAMPGMSGYDVAREIRRREELLNVYLVALTGYGQEDDRRRALEAGFNKHLTKPTSIDELRGLLVEIRPV